MNLNKKKLMAWVGLFPALAALATCASGHGTLVMSNLDEPIHNSLGLGGDRWRATWFTTGENALGYEFNSVELLMAEASGNPAGFSLSLYSSIPSEFGGRPDVGGQIAALTGPDPATGGVFGYSSADGLELSPSTAYFLVATSDTSFETDAYRWNEAGFDSEGWVADGWSMRSVQLISADGIEWSTGSRQQLQYALYATAIPEPSTLTLLGCGALLAVARWRHCARRRRSVK